MPKKSAKAQHSAASARRKPRSRRRCAAVSPNTQGTVFQEGDVSSKRIFENKTLCAQFLRDYSGIPQITATGSTTSPAGGLHKPFLGLL